MPDGLNLAKLYPRTFFEESRAGSQIAANTILGLLWQRRGFDSVVDVGCGIGCWLAAARDLGARELAGIDGPHVDPDLLLVNRSLIQTCNLEDSISLKKEFELCACLEVAEHLSPKRGPTLVEDLTRLAPVVLFSAALPYQGGEGHINEMWLEYWAHLFGKRGFLPWCGLREAVWQRQEIPLWYRQNLILFVHEDTWPILLPDCRPADPGQLSVIQPEYYLYTLHRSRPEFRTDYGFDRELFRKLAAGQEQASPGYGVELKSLFE